MNLIKYISVFVIFMTICGEANSRAANTIIEKTYKGVDGNYYKASVGDMGQGVKGPTHFAFNKLDEKGNIIPQGGNDFNYITYNKDGEVLDQYIWYSPRPTYVLNENGEVIGKKSCFTCDVVENYKYTDGGKMLVYRTDGTFVGAYNDILDYHLVSQHGSNGYSPNYKGKSDLIGNLSLVSEDGNFYDKDDNGNILGIYNKNGDITKYEYDAGGNLVSASKNGESIYERTHYTPPEAAAAMPDKNAKYSIKIDF